MKTLLVLLCLALVSASFANPEPVTRRRGTWLTITDFRSALELKGKSFVLLPTRKEYAGNRDFRDFASQVSDKLRTFGMEERGGSELGGTDYVFALDYIVSDPYLVSWGPSSRDATFTEDRYPQFVQLFVYDGRISRNGGWMLVGRSRAERSGYFSDTRCVPGGIDAIFADFPVSRLPSDRDSDSSPRRSW